MSSQIIKYSITKSNNAIYLTPEKFTKVLFFMHGLGDCADSFIDLFESAQIAPPDFKIVLLNADKNPVSINGGFIMPSWYDISFNSSNDYTKCTSESDVKKSTIKVMNYVNSELSLVNNNYKNIFFGGFSQGGCMSLYIGLNQEYDFGGIICLSGMLFPFIKYEQSKKSLPIFIAHGKKDNVIPITVAEQSFKVLLNDGLKNISYNVYNIDHTISMEELQDLKGFLNNI